MNGDDAAEPGRFVERLRALDAEQLRAFFEGMTINEIVAYVVFTVFMIGFFVWVAYLALRR